MHDFSQELHVLAENGSAVKSEYCALSVFSEINQKPHETSFT